MKRLVIIILSILVVLGFSYFVYQKINKENGAIQPIYFIPSSAAYFLEFEEPIQAWKSIKSNPLWLHLLKNKSIQNLSSGLTALDESLNENAFAFDLLGNRKLIVSAHKYKHNDYDFLYLIDVENKLTSEFVEDILSKTIDSEIQQLTSRKYKENLIVELFDKENKETIYISVYENILIVSYINSLVENSLDEYLEPTIGRDIYFTEVNNNTDNSDLFRLFINYHKIPDFSNLFMEEENPVVSEVSNSLYYSGFSFEMQKDGQFLMEGVTLPNDTLNSFINILFKSGDGESEAMKVLPNLTAFYLKIGFQSGLEFVSNFENTFRINDSIGFNDYQISNKKIEKFLNIDLQNNFYSWMGEEALYMQLQSGGLGAKNEFAFFIKTNDIEKANDNLNFIKNRIKRKTPGKFKTVNYKDFEINYLSIKGFFKAIMGEFFSKLEKPYYTIIEDYVIFSNHPQTLRIIIDRYLEKQTLANDDDYNAFISKFSNTSNITCYMNTSRLYSNLLELSEEDTKKTLYKNKNYITCFDQIGFQLEKDGNYFNTKLISTFKNPDEIKIENDLNFNKLNSLNFQTLELNNNSDEKDLFSTLPINLSDFDVKKYEDFYKNDILKVEVQIEDGVKHGLYKQYYEDGSLMLKGHFDEDLKDGTWKFYSKDGKVLEKRSYKNGVLND